MKYGSRRLNVNSSALPNGIIVASARDETAKGISICIGIRDGSRYESPVSNGSRHFLEHLVFKGSLLVSSKQFSDAIVYSGSQYNAHTDREKVLYELNVSSWNKARALFPLYADMITSPSFDDASFELEKRVVLTELKRFDKDDPDTYAETMIYTLLFPHQTIGFPICGTENNLRKMNASQLHAIHRKYYTPKRIVVIGTGLIQHKALVKLANKTLGGLIKRKINDHVVVRHQFNKEPTRHVSRRFSNESSYLLMGFDVSKIMRSRTEKSAFILLASILGNGTSSRLWQALRESLGIGYSIETWLDFSKSYVVAFIGVDCFENSDLDLAEKIIKQEIGYLQRELVSQRERCGNIQKLRRDICDEIDDTDTLRDELFYHVLVKRPQDLYKEYHEIAKVRAADIRRAAKEHFDLNNYAIVRVEGTKNSI